MFNVFYACHQLRPCIFPSYVPPEEEDYLGILLIVQDLPVFKDQGLHGKVAIWTGSLHNT